MPQRGVSAWLARLDRASRRLEDSLLIVVLLVMLTVAVAQIFLRNVMNGGFVWADEFLRLTVLWIALLGSMAAARDQRHLRIDILSRYLPSSITRWTDFTVDVFTTVVCAVLAWYSYVFVAETHEYGDLALGNQPLWWFQIILPVGFAIMTWRFAVWAVRRVLGDAPQREPV